MASDITQVIEAVERGDESAAAELLPLVYAELRRLAAQRLGQERPGQTLQATALVHEAYLRLLGPEGGEAVGWRSRGHFFAAAAEAMRRLLIERARAKGSLKRGGQRRRLVLSADALVIDPVPVEVLDLDEALRRLAKEDPTKARLVTLRFFGGLTLEEAAGVLEISATTADRHWAFARAWLYEALGGAGE